MSRSKKGGKSAGYDFWSKRPGGNAGCGPVAKAITHSKERMIDKKVEGEGFVAVAKEIDADDKILELKKEKDRAERVIAVLRELEE